MKPYINSIQLKPLLLSLLISLGTGALAGIITSDSMAAYENLIQPQLAPPSWVFPVVWTVLFTLMGISAYLVAVSSAPWPEKRSALQIYALQLIVNFIWPILFFRLEARLFAFLWLILLIILVVIMIIKFYPISPVAAFLQIPYLLWIIFAGYLNLAIYFLNN